MMRCTHLTRSTRVPSPDRALSSSFYGHDLHPTLLSPPNPPNLTSSEQQRTWSLETGEVMGSWRQ